MYSILLYDISSIHSALMQRNTILYYPPPHTLCRLNRDYGCYASVVSNHRQIIKQRTQPFQLRATHRFAGYDFACKRDDEHSVAGCTCRGSPNKSFFTTWGPMYEGSSLASSSMRQRGKTFDWFTNAATGMCLLVCLAVTLD